MLRSRVSLQFKIVALRHQVMVYQRSTTRPKIKRGDRILWSWIARRWPGWREALTIVQPATVIAWQRRRFPDHWTQLSSHDTPGRPPVPKEIRDLIRKMQRRMSTGTRHGLSASFVSSVSTSTSLNLSSRSTECVVGNHHRRPGNNFCTITRRIGFQSPF
ncbi:MAG: hypothetical protein ACI915_002400 [Gammaproteobacteria bacterium]|jgi:hypothetical protein